MWCPPPLIHSVCSVWHESGTGSQATLAHTPGRSLRGAAELWTNCDSPKSISTARSPADRTTLELATQSRVKTDEMVELGLDRSQTQTQTHTNASTHLEMSQWRMGSVRLWRYATPLATSRIMHNRCRCVNGCHENNQQQREGRGGGDVGNAEERHGCLASQ